MTLHSDAIQAQLLGPYQTLCNALRTDHDAEYKKLGYGVDDQLLLNELLTSGAHWPVKATWEDPAVSWAYDGRLRLHTLPVLLFANGTPRLTSLGVRPALSNPPEVSNCFDWEKSYASCVLEHSTCKPPEALCSGGLSHRSGAAHALNCRHPPAAVNDASYHRNLCRPEE